MRDKHCIYMRDNGKGRCIASCHLAKDGTDCEGQTGKSLDHLNHHEQPVTCGFIDGTHKEVKHSDDGTYTVNGVYNPAINHNCNWGGYKL